VIPPWPVSNFDALKKLLGYLRLEGVGFHINDNKLGSVDTKECPYCAELIKSKAIICKHCKSDLIK